MSIHIYLSDSSVKKFEQPVDILSLAKSIDPLTTEKVVGAFVNDQSEISDIRHILHHEDRVKMVTIPSTEALEVVRHSAAHVLAQAVQEIWPKVKVTIGPVIEDGFYYDFDRGSSFSEADLKIIEDKMKDIIQRKLKITKEVWPAEKAIETFKKMGETYKVELIQEINEPFVSIYKQGDWMDLCRGPHLQHLGQIGAIKVLHHSASYWRGDESQAHLQRIYGTAFHNQKDLKNYLRLVEQAKKRDHRVIGKEMNLFYFHEQASAQPFFKKSGTIIYHHLQKYLREEYTQQNYEEVISPQLYSKDLFVQSGHFDFYKSNMYRVEFSESKEAFLKPMNCPGHCLLYKSQKFSYKNLPWRVADFGRLHRCERSGTLHGLARVRGFCQDDAHIFCSPEGLEDEIKKFLQFLQDVYSTLGLSDYQIHLCTRPQKKMGSEEIWDLSEEVLLKSLKTSQIPFEIAKEEGAFYGPKLDILFVDSLKRKWQLGTLQCDFNLPQAFNLTYTDKTNQMKTPVLLHRAILGSLERFIGIYTEHCSGYFPTWLAPIQVALLSLSKDQRSYAEGLYQKFCVDGGLRVYFDDEAQSLGYKIRKARGLRIPYMIIVGKKEMQEKNVSVRLRSGQNVVLDPDQFLSQIKKEIIERKVGYSSF